MKLPTLVGISGHFADVVFILQYGKTFTVGRSREADVSLRRTSKYKLQTQAEREKDEVAKFVSSKHFQVTLYNSFNIEIKNLSPNGTQVDGVKIESVTVKDLAKRPRVIAFGLDSSFRLEMREEGE